MLGAVTIFKAPLSLVRGGSQSISSMKIFLASSRCGAHSPWALGEGCSLRPQLVSAASTARILRADHGFESHIGPRRARVPRRLLRGWFFEVILAMGRGKSANYKDNI